MRFTIERNSYNQYGTESQMFDREEYQVLTLTYEQNFANLREKEEKKIGEIRNYKG